MQQLLESCGPRAAAAQEAPGKTVLDSGGVDPSCQRRRCPVGTNETALTGVLTAEPVTMCTGALGFT